MPLIFALWLVFSFSRLPEGHGAEGSNETFPDCSTCVEVVESIHGTPITQSYMDLVSNFTIDLCVKVGGGLGYSCTGEQQCSQLCEGVVRAFAPVVLNAISNATLATEHICSLFNFCPAPPPSTVVENPLVDAEVVFDPEEERLFSASSCKKPLRVVHISDIHLDEDYQVGADTDCGLPLCARNSSGQGPTRERRAGKYGDYNGDLNMDMLKQLIAGLKKENPDFVVYTGDTPPHNIWSQDRQFNLHALTVFTEEIKKALPGVPVFPVFGNHAAFPVNQFDPEMESDAEWLYGPMAEQWKEWVPNAMPTLSKFGYYSAKVPGHPKLRMIALNSNVHSKENFWLWTGQKDWGNMLQWLEQEMSQVAAHNETFFLMAHHPPHLCYDLYRDRIYQIILKNHHRMAGAFWGHTHKDSFGVVVDENVPPQPIAVTFTAPSVTTYIGRNPSFRMYELDAETFRVLDYQLRRVDLEAQHLVNEEEPENQPDFQLVYSAKDAYNLATLSPSSLFQLLHNMTTDDDILSFYLLQRSSGRHTAVNNETRNEVLCEAVSFTLAQQVACKA